MYFKTPENSFQNTESLQTQGEKGDDNKRLIERAQHDAESRNAQKTINAMLEYLERKNEGIEENNLPEGFENVRGIEFLKRSEKDIQDLFIEKNSEDSNVSFHGNKEAEKCVGIGDTLYKEKFVLVQGNGEAFLGVRSIVNGKVGYENIHAEEPRYLAIFEGYSFRNPTEEDWKNFSQGKTKEEVLMRYTIPDENDEKNAKAEFLNQQEELQKDENEIDNVENLKGVDLLNNPEFSQKLDDVCNHLRIQREWLVRVMRKESQINPKAQNPYSDAVGLIQFSSQTARELGTSLGKIRQMSGKDQLDYVEKYYQKYAGKIHSQEDLYMATFYPKAMGKPDDYILGSEMGEGYVKLVAEQNPVISGGNGLIRKSDVSRFIFS